LENFAGPGNFHFTKNMGVTAHKFVVERACDVMNVECSRFARHFRVQEDLHPEIAEFFAKRSRESRVFEVLGRTDLIKHVEDFGGLFDQEGAQGLVGLLAVPGAASRGAETVHGFDDGFKGRALGHDGFLPVFGEDFKE
jgi:hypothetical protein